MAILNRNTILRITKLHRVAVAFSFFLSDFYLLLGTKSIQHPLLFNGDIMSLYVRAIVFDFRQL